jgi:phosphoglycolate phosphatase
MFDLVLFELDGVLLDTAPDLCDALNETLEEHCLAPVSESAVRAWAGGGVPDMVASAYAHATGWSIAAVRDSGAMDHLLREFDVRYADRCGRRGRLLGHVAPALADLRALGVRLAVVTCNEPRYCHALLHAHRLRHYFESVIPRNPLAPKVEWAQAFRTCLARCGVTPERGLRLAGSSEDAAAALHVGIACWGMRATFAASARSGSAQPERIITSVREIVDAIGMRAPHAAHSIQPFTGAYRTWP